jgi:hypothetical protein
MVCNKETHLELTVASGRGGAREGLAGAPAPARNFFSSPSLNNIYNFSLNSKAIKILAPLNFIFYFHHCLVGLRDMVILLCLWPQNFSGVNKIVVAIFMSKIVFEEMVLVANLGPG